MKGPKRGDWKQGMTQLEGTLPAVPSGALIMERMGYV